jgi:hypothetical protein
LKHPLWYRVTSVVFGRNRESLALACSIAELLTAVIILAVDWRALQGYLSKSQLPVLVSAAFIMTVYIDFISGLLHLTLDNPTITHWPVLGPAAESFQGHHDHPNDICSSPWLGHLTEMFFVNIAIRVAISPISHASVRLLTVMTDLLSMLMMASHRWAHTHPADTPWLVRLAQSFGLLITPAHHSFHHAAFVSNFAIFTGWSNPLLNTLVRTELIWPESQKNHNYEL